MKPAVLRRAVDEGYAEGFRAGQADRADGWQSDPENSDAFTDATSGYDGYYVDINEYQNYFREGFRRGYDDGSSAIRPSWLCAWFPVTSLQGSLMRVDSIPWSSPSLNA